MNQKIKRIWKNLKPEHKRAASLITAAFLFSLLSLLAYNAKKINKSEEKTEQKVEEILLDEDQLEKGMLSQTKEIQELQDQQLKVIDTRIEENEEKMTELLNAIKDLKASARHPESEKNLGKRNLKRKNPSLPDQVNVAIPPPPPSRGRTNRYTNYMTDTPVPRPKDPVKTVLIGGIGLERNKNFKKEQVELSEGKKKAPETIYLPPSFMEATLLSGVAAPTTSEARKDPSPLLFRINDLAILPNRVKANLKGCFVIGEGMGNLADERVHVRLTTLSCVAKNGTAVIDQPIKGWVVDADGKIALKGNVVAKMGTHLARSLLAGFVGGIGDGVELTTKTAAFGAGGQPAELFTNTDAANILKSGIGSGISKASDEMQKFYLELASQTLPVIEVGATKNLTLVISEGVLLEIKNEKIGG